MLTVQHLTKSFDGNPVLSDFSCTFPDKPSIPTGTATTQRAASAMPQS